jgi:uncharacterized protein involved in response to NO
MSETTLLSDWDNFIGGVALNAILVFALCVMVGAVTREKALRNLDVIVGVVILLVMLPAIIVGLWNGLSFGQHVGIAALLLAMVLVAILARLNSRKAQR